MIIEDTNPGASIVSLIFPVHLPDWYHISLLFLALVNIYTHHPVPNDLKDLLHT